MNEMASLESTSDLISSSLSVHASNGSSSSVTAGTFEHRCNGSVTATNRLSAPECNTDTTRLSLHKSRTSSSLVDVNESWFHSFRRSVISVILHFIKTPINIDMHLIILTNVPVLTVVLFSQFVFSDSIAHTYNEIVLCIILCRISKCLYPVLMVLNIKMFMALSVKLCIPA